jgi:cyclopropane fatty-acyl-phospholipid synthase-like methyltransferase
VKKNLLFYKQYQKFYQMAANSHCFSEYCKNAFGADFSQDGFSDIRQIDLIFDYSDLNSNSHVLDIGCGNGKMLKYIQRRTGSSIHGFDYSENAISTARADNLPNSDFRTGIIDEIIYPPQSFDLIVSMDTIYFTKDMGYIVKKVYDWLKKDGTFFVGYQEGDIMPKTQDCNSTSFAKALNQNGIKYQAVDYTEQTFTMLQHKRKAVLGLKKSFEKEKRKKWFNLIVAQTECVTVPFNEYKNKNARYIYIIRK